jgi:ABC-type transport system involved in multi-copper enzyme maturation permease subunit
MPIMKYLAMLKDSLRETIDSKVFIVVLAISALFIGIMATLTLTPNPPQAGLEKLVQKISDGAQEVDVPVVGRMKATQSFTEYSLLELQGPEDTSRPWEAEYHFVIESRDLIPSGGRIAVLQEILKREQVQARSENLGHNTRIKQLQNDVQEEMRRVEERERSKGADKLETQRRMGEQFFAYFQKRLEQEVNSVTRAEMEEFIREQIGSQGNWRVAEVTLLDLPAAERKIKIKARVPVQEGEDLRLKMEEVEGEVNKFRVTLVNKTDTYKLWPHKATLFFGGIPLGASSRPSELVYTISRWGIELVGAPVIMLLSCIITAFYIPNMLRKGTIDLLLAKPIGRVRLLVYKFVGGLTFMFLNTLLLIFGLWVVLGLRSRIWEPAFLLSVPVLVFEFAFFYALSTLASIWTRSPIVSILFCVVAWGLLWGIGWGHYAVSLLPKDADGEGVAIPAWLRSAANGAHTALPHYLDLDWLCDRELKERSVGQTAAQREEDRLKWAPYRWTESILVTSLYIVGLLGLACWRFWAKDY